jgi:hypothetical protein
MNWRKFHWVLCIIAAAVGVLRLLQGNLVGALFSLALAGLFASVAAEIPLLTRLKKIVRFWRNR